MNRLVILTAIAVMAVAAEKQVALKDLPPAVQKTVQDQTKGAEIKGISKETEKGKTNYEIETMVNAKHRDFDVNGQGVITEVEDETVLDSLPPAAKAAIEKKASGGKITLVETVTRGGAVSYEAGYTDKNGKSTKCRSNRTEPKSRNDPAPPFISRVAIGRTLPVSIGRVSARPV
jgi:hypothetical protein